MKRLVIDTNVPVAANQVSGEGKNGVSKWCQENAIMFLQSITNNDEVLVDGGNEIWNEYRRNLNYSGVPGIGDRFFQKMQIGQIKKTTIDLPANADGEYKDLPEKVTNSKFDRDDRKFAAIAAKERVPVINATDGDWLEHKELLAECGIRVEFLCGCDPKNWRKQS